ncbi:MAG: disulfide reductase [Candidatus Lokiarchaeota archaeon]|nr:disulfide reductase [Candidatus Lokiarchaeota archaeon]MBD3199897.1 disulfide reductase [Candidatus Lokiarchaeota archaeon]
MKLEEFSDIIHRCFRCGYCKFTYDYADFNCPSYKNFRFETFSTGGRMWLIYALMNNEINWSQRLANILYSCTTCGNCMENCRFDKFNDFLVDIIEIARIEAVKNGFCPEKQKSLLERTLNPEFYNPYGELNSDNQLLKEQYALPETAEWVYFIGCTSNYRQKDLRDATLRFLKKTNINFTLIDEHCCTSPLIRTGQTESVKEIMEYNIDQIKATRAQKVVTSCAGCCRTLKVDFQKHDIDMDVEVYHTSELVNELLEKGKIKFGSNFNKTITYHDPCHLGRHMGLYEIPREVINKIPCVELNEMKRNRENSWCCGAGGGVKIGYPDWAVNVSKERLEEAKKTGADMVVSTCPFCKTNLKDANENFDMDLEIIDLIEIIDSLELKLD